jgi:uncharacterized protein YgbK (DUF1537 family)
MSALLLSYYGDDLTGSTDVMEALASRGVPTVLFTQQPTKAQREKFSDVRAIGLAGSSRSETPAWMDEHLTPALAWLKTLGADFCHYKVCSTFDSSPAIGSIGRAIDIGQKIFAQDNVPLVVGAPQLKRYTAFGNLFAAYQGRTYRIDRHPVMARHPVTPMTEADLRLHLAKQTDKIVGLVDMTMLQADDVDQHADAIAQGAEVILFDVSDLATQRNVGRQLARRRGGCVFVVGSSGIEYALLTEWERAGLIADAPRFAEPGPVDRIAVVSGSCSATTERQIHYAEAHGFEAVAIDPKGLARGAEALVDRAIRTGLESLSRGQSVVLYTALGPESDVGAQFENESARHAIGRALGDIQAALIERAGLRRAVIAGGDTSSHALRQLDVYALTTRLPLPTTPGSPLCLAHSDKPAFDGLEIALKGGQVGSDDYFHKIRLGSI